MRVALGQLPISSDTQVNLGRISAAAIAAATAGAELAVFPEGTQARFSVDLRSVAEPLDGAFCHGLAAAARFGASAGSGSSRPQRSLAAAARPPPPLGAARPYFPARSATRNSATR